MARPLAVRGVWWVEVVVEECGSWFGWGVALTGVRAWDTTRWWLERPRSLALGVLSGVSWCEAGCVVALPGLGAHGGAQRGWGCVRGGGCGLWFAWGVALGGVRASDWECGWVMWGG